MEIGSGKKGTLLNSEKLTSTLKTKIAKTIARYIVMRTAKQVLVRLQISKYWSHISLKSSISSMRLLQSKNIDQISVYKLN